MSDWWDELDYNPANRVTVRCSVCGGSGEVPCDDDDDCTDVCPECGGSGEEEVTPSEERARLKEEKEDAREWQDK